MEPAADYTEESPRVSDRKRRLQWQMILAGAAVVTFVVLLVVWLQSDTSNVDGWMIFLLILLVLILIGEILLLEPIWARLFRTVPESLPRAEDEDTFVIGCPGCGTVFSMGQSELQSGEFSCHNCGRMGYVADYNLSRSAIQEENCQTCGNAYLEYMEYSECPVCHTFNEY